jgi:hypothetical protein
MQAYQQKTEKFFVFEEKSFIGFVFNGRSAHLKAWAHLPRKRKHLGLVHRKRSL